MSPSDQCKAMVRLAVTNNVVYLHVYVDIQRISMWCVLL